MSRKVLYILLGILVFLFLGYVYFFSFPKTTGLLFSNYSEKKISVYYQFGRCEKNTPDTRFMPLIFPSQYTDTLIPSEAFEDNYLKQQGVTVFIKEIETDDSLTNFILLFYTYEDLESANFTIKYPFH